MTKIEDTVRIPPYRFDDPLEEVAIQTLNDTYNGRLDKKLGLLISITSPSITSCCSGLKNIALNTTLW